MSLLNYLGLGAIVVFFCSLCKNKDKTGHSRTVPNVVEPPPTVRDPIGGHSIFYGYFGRTNTAPSSHNKNSIL
jgi:hypothetical protein